MLPPIERLTAHTFNRGELSPDLDKNPDIPFCANLANFFRNLPNWKVDPGKREMFIKEDKPFVDYVMFFRFSTDGGNLSVQFLPRRSETEEFARQKLGEQPSGALRISSLKEAKVRDGVTLELAGTQKLNGKLVMEAATINLINGISTIEIKVIPYPKPNI